MDTSVPGCGPPCASSCFISKAVKTESDSLLAFRGWKTLIQIWTHDGGSRLLHCVCVCVSAFFLWCHKTSLLCGSKRAFIRRVKRFLRHSNTGRMFPALIVCDQRFTSNCSEHFELWKITKWSANGKTGPWNRDTRVEVTTPGDKETAVFALCFYCVHIQQSY